MKEENGPLIALVAFIILALIFGYYAYQSHAELNGTGAEGLSKEKEIEDKNKDVEKLKETINKYRKQAEGLKEAIKQQEVIYNYFAGLYDEYGGEYDRRKALLDLATSYEQQAGQLQTDISQMKQTALTNCSKDSAKVRDDMDTLVQGKNKARDDAISRKNQVEEDFKVFQKHYKDNKNRAQAELSKTKNVLTDLTQRDVERANIFNQACGKVLLADPVSNVVVINIGTAVGVKNGFRFECFAARAGEGRVSKGYIQVRHADPSKAECFVIQKVVALPTDAFSDYVASEPEELYSPYQASAQAGGATKGVATGAQPLAGKPKMALTGQQTLDPIVEGDLIENPFFAPGRTRTFFIAGSKKIENGRQKSAIRYTWLEIKAVIESYGGKVSPVADTNVDYMIVQKNPETTECEDSEKEEFRKAKYLGIPAIYEWELFRFLDTK